MMFQCRFAKMYDNQIFTKYQVTPIPEDYFKVEGNFFCVADGVTRDNIKGEAVPYPTTKQEVEEWIKYYPNPSGAYEAAKLCCEEFVKALKSKEIFTQKEIKEAALSANRAIAKINEGRTIDYLKEDLYCCEAVGGVIIGETLYCFSVGDCHITVLDQEANILFTTEDPNKKFEHYINEIYQKEHGYDWFNAQDRKMVRKEFRNNISKKYQGEAISFGALTGEETANAYIHTYEIDLKKAYYIGAYSDGCEPFFKEKEERRKVIENPESIGTKGKERTLIFYQREE